MVVSVQGEKGDMGEKGENGTIGDRGSGVSQTHKNQCS